MCVSVSPGVSVRFSKTILLASETVHPDGDVVHVLGYQNKVKTNVGLRSWVRSRIPLGRSGNAMLLPFPALCGTMSSTNVLDTKSCPDILQDVKVALEWQPERSVDLGYNLLSIAAANVEIFEAGGIYTVVLAGDANAIPGVLEQVPKARRPKLNPKLFSTYAKWYPGWTFALCCFDQQAAQLADPLVWWYKPMNPNQLFLPTLDCHTGDVPNLAEKVSLDHTIAVSSYRMNAGHTVNYRDVIPAPVKPFLPAHVTGEWYRTSLPNADFVCDLADVIKGTYNPTRLPPPGA